MHREFRPEAIWQAHAKLYRDLLEERSQCKRQSGVGMSKRLFDLFAAAIVLIVFSPVIAIVAILVRIFLGSPVLFAQVRPGLKARPFTCLKFRTMTDERDQDGRLLSDAQRLTSFGKCLRSTSLDELPGLINVLRGEMSLVGPRPLLMEYLTRYTPEQARRHDVKPGITGWAQVNGRNALTWEEKFEYDTWYVDNHSLRLDGKILALTVWKAIKREGISRPGYATMPKFTQIADQATQNQ
jgi:sugar transferase EpsL